MSADRLAAAAGALDTIGLDELNARAALQRRTDRKYLLTIAQLDDLLGALADDHDALEIAGTRTPSYESVYHDTPDLRCFRDHVEDVTPRFKVRSRLYVNTRVCSFEVKVKSADETRKEHLDCTAGEHGRLTAEARAFADRALRRHAGTKLPDDLSPALTTRFSRATLAARDGSERVTIDVDLRLERPDGACAWLPGEHVLVESKSSDGAGRCDAVLHEHGVEDLSLSKYRTGIALLTDAPGDAGAAADRFVVG